jgi:hypothetical protein
MDTSTQWVAIRANGARHIARESPRAPGDWHPACHTPGWNRPGWTLIEPADIDSHRVCRRCERLMIETASLDFPEIEVDVPAVYRRLALAVKEAGVALAGVNDRASRTLCRAADDFLYTAETWAER